MQRVEYPTVYRPAKIPIVASGNGVNGRPSCFCRFREGKGIRPGLGTAGIERTDLSAPLAFRLHVLGELVAVGDAEVVEVCLDFLVVVAGQRDFEVRVSSLDDLDSLAHRLHRTLVHRDSGLLEPPFLAEMLRKVFQEDTPVFGVGFLARFSIEELYAVGRLVVVVERQRPRYHRVATDLLVDAYSQHKFHPAVEHRIIISPSPVYLLDAGNHAVEMVFSLSRPRLVHDAGGDGFLSGIGQHLHNRAHQFEMFLTPERYVVVTSHGIRILP